MSFVPHPHGSQDSHKHLPEISSVQGKKIFFSVQVQRIDFIYAKGSFLNFLKAEINQYFFQKTKKKKSYIRE